ncbi:unnamed protein product [Callosobruchus maculatus]|uniref:Uncharacterized protein n=1 Tax=Callosobruchus maculatus TaxID=64391 RepID=A0A653D0R6_CALMS|nr:unnamed protein product [Callosobruchus maculatus]
MSKSNSQYSDHPWSDVTSKLHLAKKKLAPVIKNLMESASGDSDHPARPSMTVDEYSDAVWAAGILAEVEETLEKSKKKRYMKLPHNLNTKFDFPTKDVKVNESGKVNIDTSVLVQLIELHQSLGTIINNINEVRCDAENQLLRKEKKKNNNIMLKVVDDDKPDETQSLNMEEDGTCNKLGRQIVVMAANVVTDKNGDEADTRKTKSTGSLYDRSSKSSNKVDSAGAKKIIINCIADLDKVKEFLESDTERSGPASQKSGQKSQKSTSKSSRGESSEEPQTATESGEGSSSAQEILLEESDLNSSKIVICIKGQNEEDLQIVIRQCPECKQNNIEPAPAQPPTRVPSKQPSIKFSNTEIPPEDCIPINMYDAHRVCVTTPTGEELLLTLTVAPRNAGSPGGASSPLRNRSTQMRLVNCGSPSPLC